MDDVRLYQGDCLKIMKDIPDGSIDLVLTDPPYNIGVQTERKRKKIINAWDRIDNYIPWSISWLKECQRVLKLNGVLYFWHNDIKQIAELLEAIKKETDLELISFCIWDKGISYRARSWQQRDPDGKTSLRSWFNICEYCLHFFNSPRTADNSWRHTGLDKINSNPECYRPLKEWYAREKERLDITDKDVARKYKEVTGREPHMLRHYFRDSQFEIPTKEIFKNVYEPLGFKYCSSEGRQGYEGLRQEYEGLRQEYEKLRNYHRCDAMHCNIWHEPQVPTNHRLHTCQKPVKLLERMVRVSSRQDAVVLDPFMGSGSTGVAAVREGRKFIGIELDQKYFETACQRIDEEVQFYKLAYTE